MKHMPENIRKRYKRTWVAFGFRILVLVAVVLVVFLYPDELKVLEGMNFFRHFSVLHLLWGLWMWYMLKKLLPFRNSEPRGCMKYQRSQFQPTEAYTAYRQGRNPEFQAAFQAEKRKYGKGAWLVLAVWILAALGIGILRGKNLLGNRELLIISALFYVGDLVCILIWCPFRDIMMKNRCCTQCRIYNWDTVMLILPIAFIPGFFSYSLLFTGCIVVGIWEGSHVLHPERFYSMTNSNLQCQTCRGEPGCQQYRRQKNCKGKCKENYGNH